MRKNAFAVGDPAAELTDPLTIFFKEGARSEQGKGKGKGGRKGPQEYFQDKYLASPIYNPMLGFPVCFANVLAKNIFWKCLHVVTRKIKQTMLNVSKMFSIVLQRCECLCMRIMHDI